MSKDRRDRIIALNKSINEIVYTDITKMAYEILEMNNKELNTLISFIASKSGLKFGSSFKELTNKYFRQY